jgi:hypothetical protein
VEKIKFILLLFGTMFILGNVIVSGNVTDNLTNSAINSSSPEISGISQITNLTPIDSSQGSNKSRYESLNITQRLLNDFGLIFFLGFPSFIGFIAFLLSLCVLKKPFIICAFMGMGLTIFVMGAIIATSTTDYSIEGLGLGFVSIGISYLFVAVGLESNSKDIKAVQRDMAEIKEEVREIKKTLWNIHIELLQQFKR